MLNMELDTGKKQPKSWEKGCTFYIENERCWKLVEFLVVFFLVKKYTCHTHIVMPSYL